MHFLSRPAALLLCFCFAPVGQPSRAAQKDFSDQPEVTFDPIPRASPTPQGRVQDSAGRRAAQETPPAQTPSKPSQSAGRNSSGVAEASGGKVAYETSGDSSHRSGNQPSLNNLVVRAIEKMPASGGYSLSAKAAANLRKAISLDEKENLVINPSAAKPSFCSGATYLVFLSVLGELERSGGIVLDKSVKERLLHRSQPDGVGVWGRWNANGPGVARLFHQLNLGRNFTDLSEAKPGDFLKIWWTDEIGSAERGHLVIFLGSGKTGAGEPTLRFWSSNIPDGYGEKTIPLAKAKRLLFSRLGNPQGLRRVAELSDRDDFLAAMLTKSFSMDEVKSATGVGK